MNQVLKDQVAIVTGGSRGIGRGIARKLSEAGATVVLTSRSEDGAAKAAAEIADETAGSNGGAVIGKACDSGDAQACADLVKSVTAEYGRLDILVNNAGVTRDKLIMRMSPEDWESVFPTNLHGVFYLSKAAVRPMMKQRSGRIINISSIVAATGNPGQTNYAATKAGIVGFSKSLAKEIGSRGITVNVVSPGYVETGMSDEISDEMKTKMFENIPLRRLGTPGDIAEAVLFLASPGAAYITGIVLNVDGGMAM